MTRQGRILIVEDDPFWREQVVQILQDAGYLATAVPGFTEALKLLKTEFYHVMFLDLRIVSGAATIDGIELLNRMKDLGLSEGVKVIVLSAYGDLKRASEAFRDHKVADFLSKGDFSRRGVLESVHKVFAQQVNINHVLVIHPQAIGGMEQAVLNLELDDLGIKRGSDEQKHMATELEDLFCRLFHRARSIMIKPLAQGRSGAGVVRVKPFYTTGGGGHEVVVKFGSARQIEKEYRNFRDYVQPFLGGGRNTMALDFRRTPHLGAIMYSLLGTINDQLHDFGEFYRNSDIEDIKKALDSIFLDTCRAWYANRGQQEPLDLATEYQNLLSYKPEDLEPSLADLCLFDEDKQHISFKSLRGRHFLNPLVVAKDLSLTHSTYTCITHGDLNARNLLVDGDIHVWMLDFQNTGQSHVLRDIAMLDSTVRFLLLATKEATLNSRLLMEEAFETIERFSQLEALADSFVAPNSTLKKAFDTVVHLRKLARRVVDLNDDMVEYSIALFYNALNFLRFSSLSLEQHQHALLCASILARRLSSATRLL